jgi:hypothetical protein
MKVKIPFALLALISYHSFSTAQESIEETNVEPEVVSAGDSNGGSITESFASIRVLSNHSIEMIPKRNLEFIVSHKFGDLAGSGGGFENWFGFDNLADVRIAFRIWNY